MLEVESGISPEVIAARGYWTATTAAEVPEGFDWYQVQPRMFPILVIPQWNSVGRLFAHVLRPDRPRRGKDGKPVKYEAQPGAPVGFDVPPTMVHLLRDPSVPLYITEGSKKADAMASRGLLCISLAGVYGFLTKKVITSELDEVDCDGRTVRPVFDNDVMTKLGPADALDRLSGACARRGARTERVILRDPHNPTAPAGTAKIGIDDYFVRGGRPADLETLAQPWQPVSHPRNMIEYADPYAEIERLRADNAALTRTITNPHVKEKHKIAVARLVSIGMSKASRGKDMDDQGRVRVSAREIANDWREREAKGERAKPVNPDGSAFLMDRDSVHGLLNELRDDFRVVDFTTVEIKKTRKANNLPYTDREFLITPPASLADVLGPVAQYTPSAPKVRPYTQQAPCIYCGQVHTRKVVCMGCDRTVKVLPVPVANDPNATEEQRRDLDERTALTVATTEGIAERVDPETGEILEDSPIAGKFPAMGAMSKASSAPAPVNYSAGNFPAMENQPKRAGLWNDPSVDTCTTMGCRNLISPRRTYICDECAAHLGVAS